MKTLLFVSLSLASLALAACAEPDTGTASGRVIIDQPCAADTDCPTGFECEIEVEHGVTTSYCQSDEESDGTCPAGYELEIEHGQAYCQPHGGSGGGSGGSGGGSGGGADDGSGGGSGSGSGADDGSGGGSGSGGGGAGGTTGATCTTNADCATGLECEVQTEGGVTTSTCQPHGGGGN